MLYSNEHNFTFIKTRKTAGTSVEIALSRYCSSSSDIVTPLVPEDERIRQEKSGGVYPRNYKFTLLDWCTLPFRIYDERRLYRNFDIRLLKGKYWNHVGGRIIKNRLGENMERSYVFTVERDPWDKIVSLYYWLLRYLNKNGAEFSFDVFFDEGWVEWLSDYHLYAEGGEVFVDAIIDFDFLGDGLDKVADQPSLPNGQQGFIRSRSATKLSLGSNQSNDQLFDERKKDKVRVMFAREIQLFDFREDPLVEKAVCGPFLFSAG